MGEVTEPEEAAESNKQKAESGTTLTISAQNAHSGPPKDTTEKVVEPVTPSKSTALGTERNQENARKISGMKSGGGGGALKVQYQQHMGSHCKSRKSKGGGEDRSADDTEPTHGPEPGPTMKRAQPLRTCQAHHRNHLWQRQGGDCSQQGRAA